MLTRAVLATHHIFCRHPKSAFVVGSCAAGYFILVMFLTVYSMLYDTQVSAAVPSTGTVTPGPGAPRDGVPCSTAAAVVGASR